MENENRDAPDLQDYLLAAGLAKSQVNIEPIHGGMSGSEVFRIRVKDHESMVLKILDPSKLPEHLVLSYPRLAETEWRFYTELAPKLDLTGPRVFAAGQLSHGGSFILMEDLSLRYRIPTGDHRWSDEELRSILTTFALLHGRSVQLFASKGVPDWLNPDPRSSYNAEQVTNCLGEFVANSWTQAQAEPICRSPRLEQLAESVGRALDHLRPGILYNDFYPCNVAIPQCQSPAVIFDWQLIGSGPLQIDIVNIGLLGHTPAFASIDHDALLEFYLDRLGEVTGVRPDTTAFRETCRWASLLAWGIFLPRMVRAMHRANQQGSRFSPGMANLYETCMAEWGEALKDG